MALRCQDILYLVIIYFKLQSSTGYGKTHLGVVSLDEVSAASHQRGHGTTAAAFSLYSSLTDRKQKILRSEGIITRRAVDIGPEGSRIELQKGGNEVAAYSINDTSLIGGNVSMGYALMNSEVDASAGDYENNDNDFETIPGDEVQMPCVGGDENNPNCTVSNQTCFEDNLPCNATQTEYMQFLYDYMYPKTSEWILIFVHGIVFITGLVTDFLLKKNLPVKALLLINNAPSHPSEMELKTEDGNIIAMFFPPNVTPLIQPMDQNAIKITKLYYRNSLLAMVAAKNLDLVESMKSVTLRDAITILEPAWNKVSKDTMVKCWQNVLRFTENETDPEEDIPLSILRENMNSEVQQQMELAVDLLNELNPQVGNALVCVAVYTNYSMRTVTNVFIVNLAVADFLVILVCLPPSVVWDVTETWFLGQSMCKIVLYFQTVSVTVSVLTLTFISVDRWYAICFPLRYRTKISRAIASVSFIWIVALLSDIPEFLALHLKKPKLRFESVLFTQCGTTWDLKTEMNFYLTQLVLLYILPLLLMMIAYFKIVRILWKSDTIPGHRESRTHHQYSCGYLRGSSTMVNTSTMGQLRARRKAAKMLVAVVVMFATCYFPVHVFNLLRYTGNLTTGEITTIFSLCSHWLCYANSAVNPVIYNFMSGKFRREFRNALDKCRCGRVRVEDRSFNQSNPTSRLHNISPSTRSNYNLTSVRDITITRDISRQTMQTTFVENCGNGHSAATPMLNSNKDL